MSRRPGRRRTASLVTALLLFPACGATQVDDPDGAASSTGPGLTACTAPAPAAPVEGGLPDVVLPCLTDGPEVRLSDLRGPLLVNVWAQWCGPCRTEAPFLAALHDSGKVRLVGIDYVDPRPDAAKVFALEHGLDYMHLRDPDKLVQPAVKVTGPPVTVFVDRDGRIAYTHHGPFTSQAQLNKLVADKLGVTV